MMRARIPCLLFVLMLSAMTTVNGDLLSEMTRTIEGRTRRASSGLFDPESNQDAYHVGPGETVALPVLHGPGEIRHM